MRPRTVVLLIDELNEWNGSEVHVFRLLSHLDRARMRGIAAVVGPDGLGPEFRQAGLGFVSLDIHRVLAWSGARGLYQIVRLLRRERADLLVAYHTAADLLAPLAGRLAGVPVLSCRRDDGFTKKPLHVRLQRLLNPLLCGMIAVSHHVVEAVERQEGYPRRRIQVIWNGEDLRRFAPASPSTSGPSPDPGLSSASVPAPPATPPPAPPPAPASSATRSALRRQLGLSDETCVIFSASALNPVKDHATQLDAFARLLPAHPESCLVLAGLGPEEERIRARARPLGNKVRVVGHRNDMPELLRTADIFLQTSLTEGFSNAIVQAMATALPVVATRVGGNPELVPPDCGLLVPPGDANAVAAALGSLLASPALRRELGTRARLHVERHCHLEGMVEAYMDAFERVMVGRFPGAPAGCLPEMGGPR